MAGIKKTITINGRRVDVILPKGMKDCPDNIITDHSIVNVGIRKYQKEIIREVIEKGKSINSFVQDAVDDKLYAFHAVRETGGKDEQ